MKIPENMKRLLMLLSLTLYLGIQTGQAQDTFFQSGNANTEEQAKALTKEYQPELVMTGDQTLLFEKKLEEFLIREAQIRELDLSVADKIHLLTKLSEQQQAEMANILTRPQLRRYARINATIQPLPVVVDSIKTNR